MLHPHWHGLPGGDLRDPRAAQQGLDRAPGLKGDDTEGGADWTRFAIFGLNLNFKKKEILKKPKLLMIQNLNLFLDLKILNFGKIQKN